MRRYRYSIALSTPDTKNSENDSQQRDKQHHDVAVHDDLPTVHEGPDNTLGTVVVDVGVFQLRSALFSGPVPCGPNGELRGVEDALVAQHSGVSSADTRARDRVFLVPLHHRPG